MLVVVSRCFQPPVRPYQSSDYGQLLQFISVLFASAAPFPPSSFFTQHLHHSLQQRVVAAVVIIIISHVQSSERATRRKASVYLVV